MKKLNFETEQANLNNEEIFVKINKTLGSTYRVEGRESVWVEKFMDCFKELTGLSSYSDLVESVDFRYVEQSNLTLLFESKEGRFCTLGFNDKTELFKPSAHYQIKNKKLKKEFRKAKQISQSRDLELIVPNDEKEFYFDAFRKAYALAEFQGKPRPVKERKEREFYISVIVPSMTGGFQVKTVELQFESNDSTLPLFYGDDFSEFHTKLIERFKSSTKGIALFHGYPGTGKTSYIRHLAKSLNDAGKRVVFMPAAVFNQIGTPEFTAFMLEEFGDDGRGTVFVLEDAENLLKQREGSADADKVSNLLNLGDGILNDLFNIQVIATFNTELENIDPAFLRAGRLLARKNFKKLSVEDSIRLAKHLKVDNLQDITKEMSLAEVFALKESITDEVLIEK